MSLGVFHEEICDLTLDWALSRKTDIDAGKPESTTTKFLERKLMETLGACKTERELVNVNKVHPELKPLHRMLYVWARSVERGPNAEILASIYRNDVYQLALIEHNSRKI